MWSFRNSLPMRGSDRQPGVAGVIAGGLLFSLFSADVCSETFDESVNAPATLVGEALTAKAGAYFEQFDADAPVRTRLLMDDVEHASYVDLIWHFGRAIDARENLDGLSQYGVSLGEGTSHKLDLERFPQWRPQYHRIAAIFDPDRPDHTTTALKQRGFRDSDIDRLRKYLSRHSPISAVMARTAPLTRSFAERVKARVAAGDRLDRADMMAYSYQRHRAIEQATRTWAAELLDVLDADRQRIVESYLLSFQSSMAAAPSDTRGEVERLERYFLSEDYVQAIETQIWIGEAWSRAWSSEAGQR